MNLRDIETLYKVLNLLQDVDQDMQIKVQGEMMRVRDLYEAISGFLDVEEDDEQVRSP